MAASRYSVKSYPDQFTNIVNKDIKRWFLLIIFPSYGKSKERKISGPIPYNWDSYKAVDVSEEKISHGGVLSSSLRTAVLQAILIGLFSLSHASISGAPCTLLMTYNNVQNSEGTILYL